MTFLGKNNFFHTLLRREDDGEFGKFSSQSGFLPSLSASELAVGGDEQEGGAPALVGEARLGLDLVEGRAPFLDMG
jgi:hypothetical protein